MEIKEDSFPWSWPFGCGITRGPFYVLPHYRKFRCNFQVSFRKFTGNLRARNPTLRSKKFIQRYPLPIIIRVRLGANVKTARRRGFMTQAQLAKAAGISQRTLVNIETNKVEPHFSTILKLAEALGTDPSKLVDQDEP